MSVFEKMGTIRIIKTPEGGMPLDLREKWVGVEMPCLFYERKSETAKDLVTNTLLEPRDSYIVLQEHAIEALALVLPEAAQEWMNAGYPKEEKFFSFRMDEAEELTPVLSKMGFIALLNGSTN